MPPALNRALQVRAVERLRARLARDEASGLPGIAALSADDERELWELAGGTLTAVVIRIGAWRGIEPAERPGRPRQPEPIEPVALRQLQAQTVRDLVPLIQRHVRRTDLLVLLRPEALLLLAPGLDADRGQSLAARLLRLLGEHLPALDPSQAGLRLVVGAAYHTAESNAEAPISCAALAEQAEHQPVMSPPGG